MGQTLTTGFDGMSEHVMKQLGISDQQYEALRTTAQTLKVQRGMLKEYGKTNSKSMNTALRQQIAMRKKIDVSAVTDKDMAEATDDDLFTASEMSNAMKKDNEKAFDLAEEQYNVTSSIGDKLDNVISYLLEQILKLLNPLVDVVNDILMWIMDGDKKKAQATARMADEMKQQTKGTLGAAEMIDAVSKAVQKGVGAGKTGKDLAQAVAASGAFDAASLGGLTTKDLVDFAQRTGGASKDLLSAFQGAQKRGDVEGMLKAIDNLPGDMNENLMKLSQLMAQRGMVSQAYKDVATGKATFARPGAARALTAKEKRDQAAAGEAGDIEALGTPIAGAPAGGVGVTGAPVATGGPAGTTPTDTKNTQNAIQTQADTTGKIVSNTQAQIDATEQQYQATSDVLSLLKKGVRFEQSWMVTKFHNVIKDSTLESLRQALMEHLILSQQAATSPGFQKGLADWGWQIATQGITPQQLMTATGATSPAEAIAEMLKPHQTGIMSVPYDNYVASLHRGERVLTANEARGMKEGGGGRVTVVNIQATGVPASAIAHAISNIQRSD